MVDKTIECPNCGTKIELTEALTGQIERSVKAKYIAEAAKKEKQITEKVEALKKQEEELHKKQQSIDFQVDNKLKAERAKIAEQKKVLEEKQQQIDEQVSEKLKVERKDIAESERKKILTEQAEEKKALEEELEEKRKEVSEAKKKELDFLRKQRELEEKAENIELEVEKTLAEQRKKIADDAKQKASDELQLKMKEKDQLIDVLKKQAQDWQRRAEQGSQEAQGEVLEGALQETLQQAFPFDLFEEVKKGQRGADILQIVRNQSGKECGKIIWESKNTKNYSNAWTEKLKNDQLEAGADIAVLATIALPKEIKTFGLLEGVWVGDLASVLGMATALRIGLINVTREKMVTANQDTVKDVIYRYVTGQEFAMQIRAIAEAFGRMKDDLDKEKRAMEKIWKSREKQIETVLSNVGGIQGSLQGYLGSKALPDSGILALESISEEDSE